MKYCLKAAQGSVYVCKPIHLININHLRGLHLLNNTNNLHNLSNYTTVPVYSLVGNLHTGSEDLKYKLSPDPQRASAVSGESQTFHLSTSL